MNRIIVAIVVGFLIGFIVAQFLGVIGLYPSPPWLGRILRVIIPFLVGGFFTGYIARRHGLILGLVIAVLFYLPLWTLHFLIGIGTLNLGMMDSLVIIMHLLTTMAAGHLGQHVAQIRHMRHQEKE